MTFCWTEPVEQNRELCNDLEYFMKRYSIVKEMARENT